MGLLLFFRGYSSAAGLYRGREGDPIGRYKHSHRPIVLACTVIAYPSSTTRFRTPRAPKTAPQHRSAPKEKISIPVSRVCAAVLDYVPASSKGAAKTSESGLE